MQVFLFVGLPFWGVERTKVMWWGSENWKGRERDGVECLSNVNGFNRLNGRQTVDEIENW